MSQITGWHREDIKGAVRKRGANLNELSRRAGLEPSAVRKALHKGHRLGEAVIAAFLGVPAAELWPERYDERGVRREPLDLRRLRRG